MDLGMRADCSLKTSIYCCDQNKQQNPLASLRRILEIKYKTQPTQSHGPVTRPKTKGMIQKAAKKISAFLQLKAITTVQESCERTSKIIKIQPSLSQLP